MDKLIIDGTYLMHRVSIKPFSHFLTADGRNSGMIYGFMQAIRPYIGKYDISIAWDQNLGDETPNPWRKKVYPLYKMNRVHRESWMWTPAQAQDLYALLRGLGFDLYYAPKWEADDILYTLAHKCPNFAYKKVFCLCRDKDMFQIVDNRVRILWPDHSMKGIITIGPPEVLDRLGVEPCDVVRMLAIMGDTSDNIPNPPGIGPVTAAKYLNGTLDKESNKYATIEKWIGSKNYEINLKLTRLYDVKSNLVVLEGERSAAVVKNVLAGYEITKFDAVIDEFFGLIEPKKVWW